MRHFHLTTKLKEKKAFLLKAKKELESFIFPNKNRHATQKALDGLKRFCEG